MPASFDGSPTPSPRPWTVHAGGVRLAIRVTPKSARNGVTGLIPTADGRVALSLRIAALPVDGAANAAVKALLADTLRVGKAAITITSGLSARLKMVEVAGEPQALVARLVEVVG